MRSVKINHQKLYQPRRYINNRPIKKSREADRGVFLSYDEFQLEEETCWRGTRRRRRRARHRRRRVSPEDSKRERETTPFMRGTHVLDNELHKPRLESKLKVLRVFRETFNGFHSITRRLCRVYVFLRNGIKFNLVSEIRHKARIS